MEVNLDEIISGLWRCKLPNAEGARFLLTKGESLLKEEPNLLKLHSPITVCGDIHGQFYDLIELFSVAGRPPLQNFLFLGDYVDRGFFCTETFFLLLALKVRYPTKIHLLRGNHECASITEQYGFKDEVERKYPNMEMYDACVAAFNALPIAATIDDKIFCVHGGLSPDLKSLSQLEEINRFCEPPDTGVFSDILWSDPDEVTGYTTSQRGAGFVFGGDVAKTFLDENNLAFMLRAHQLVNEGYREMFDGRLYTVWSAPNYLYREGNIASVLEITSVDKKRFKIFTDAPSSARGALKEPNLPMYFL